MDKIVRPFSDKATESYQLAVERGQDLQVYTEAYRDAFAKMKTKNPEQYYDAGEKTGDSRLLDAGMVQP